MEEAQRVIIHAEHNEPLAAALDAWLDPAIEEDSAALAAFLQGAKSLGPAWASLSTGGPGHDGRCVSFTFAPRHMPDGLFEVRDWLRSQPAVRLVEVERYHPPVT